MDYGDQTDEAGPAKGIATTETPAFGPAKSAQQSARAGKAQMTAEDGESFPALLEATHARRCKELHIKFYGRVGFFLGAVSYVSGTAALASALNNLNAAFSVLAATVFALFQYADFKIDPTGEAASHRIFCREYNRLIGKKNALSQTDFEQELQSIRSEDTLHEVEAIRYIAQHEDLIEHGLDGEAFGKYRLTGWQAFVRMLAL